MRKIVLLIPVIMFSAVTLGQSSFDYMLKAIMLDKEGRRPEAFDLLSGAMSRFSDYRLYLIRAGIRFSQGDLKGASEDYENSNRLNPGSGEYGLSKVFAVQKNIQSSIAHLEKSMNTPFRKNEKEIMMEEAFSSIENSPEWRQFLKKDWYSQLDEGISEIEFYCNSGKTAEALEMRAELAGQYPEKNEISYVNALTEFSSGKYQEAVRDINKAISADPENEKYLRLLGKSQTAVSNFAGASSTFSKLISLEIPDATLFLDRAECYRRTGEYEKSMSDINKYLDLYPEDKKGLSLAGKVEAASGDNLKAIEFFSKNLALHPDDPRCFSDRADSYFNSRSWTLAVRDYSMSLDLNPGNADVWLSKGISLVNTGKPEDACHDFYQARNLGSKRATEYISRYCIK